MGDRANVYVVDDKPETGIYLYTHWSGEEWPERLREALKAARSRWDDPQYGVRVVVSQMFSDIHDSETGGGISTVIGDNSYPILVCDFTTQSVYLAPEGSERDQGRWDLIGTFEEYVAQPDREWPGR